MATIKIIGIILLVAGLSLAVYTLITAKRSGIFDDIKELRLIKASGYTKEHEEKRIDDVYRKEPIAQQSRLISRRAQKVLDKMDQEAKEGAPSEGSRTNSTAPKAEEISVNGKRWEEKISKNPEEWTAPLFEQSDLEEATAALNNVAEEETSMLVKATGEEGTAPLVRTPQGNSSDYEEGTDILARYSNEDATGILSNKNKRRDAETEGIGESTDVLVKQ